MTIFNYRYNGYLADYLDRYAYDAVFNKTSVSQYLKKMQNTVQDEVDAQMTN
jgi:multiple sugar transport system substrate-binding protein